MAVISAKLQERLLSILGDREDAREMINALSNVAPSTIPPYSSNFGIGDWLTDTNGNYYISVLASVHSQGIFPTIQIFGLDGINYDEVTVDRIFINNSGDVTFSVPTVPDARFIGKVIIS